MKHPEALEVKINVTGNVWWTPAKEHAKEILFQHYMSRDELAGQDIEGMRRMGKTFQVCLASVRHMLKGKKVIIRTANTSMAQNIQATICNIVKKSFSSAIVVDLQKKITPSYSVSYPPTRGSIQIATMPRDEQGFPADFIFEDELEYGNVTHMWTNRSGAPRYTSKQFLKSILSGD